MAPKRSLGRQKIPLTKILDNGKRSVTFSKRKSGILKKSSELSTLCGANMGVILFSESGRAYSYVNPKNNAVFDNFMGDVPLRGVNLTSHQIREADQRIPQVLQMESQIMETEKKLELEQHEGKTMALDMTEQAKEKWWENPIEEMNLMQLAMIKAKVDELKVNFDQEKNMKLEEQNPLLLLARTSQNQFYQ